MKNGHQWGGEPGAGKMAIRKTRTAAHRNGRRAIVPSKSKPRLFARSRAARDEANVARDEARLLASEYRTFLAQQTEKCRELEAAVARYGELFDFAPLGYVSFDRNGLICEINLQGAKLL